MARMWGVLFLLLFVVEGSLYHKQEALRGFILHQSNPPCHAVDTNKLIPCTLNNQDDFERLRSGNSAPGQLNIGCKDDSNNMTCLPLSLGPARYYCACDSEKSNLNAKIGWNDWEKISESGLAHKRSLCDTQADWCLDGMFITNLMYLVKIYAPLDSQITVSSIFAPYFDKEKIRFDYYGEQCAWVKSASDFSPWIKFDLLQSRGAIGVQIGKRCYQHSDQFVTSFHVSTSVDDTTWSYIGTDIQAVYDGMLFTWWFDRVVSARFWRIEPVTYNGYAAMQADFIG